MSAFTVELRRIARVDPHPNADRLEVARLDGLAWEFVVPKGGFQRGFAVSPARASSCGSVGEPSGQGADATTSPSALRVPRD